MTNIVLASGSAIRRQLLENAGLSVTVKPARIDEQTIKESLLSEGAKPTDVADALAEFKAQKMAATAPEAWVIGCDQVLDLKGDVISKPESPDEAAEQLRMLSGKTHQLLSAAVMYHGGQPVWRHVGQVRLTMRQLGNRYIEEYVARNWESIRHSVGAYKIEEEGVRLMSRIEGDHFTILGLPLLELLSFLTLREVIEG